jgi:hypothetical protein
MSIIIRKNDRIISNILFAIRHHAVIETADSSIMGTHHIQFSLTELRGVYFDIFGYIIATQYIFARENMFPILE